MSQSAVSTKHLGSGRELKTDGLLKHLGQGDFGALRLNANMNVNTGAGLELLYDRPGQQSYIQSVDRDVNLYRDMILAGRNINFYLSGGTLNLPANSVGTAQITANAVSAPVGSYLNTTTFGTTGVNVWQETPITTGTITLSGALIRVEWSVVFANNTAGAANQIGVGWNGTMLWPVAMFHEPTANYVQSCGGTFYTTPSAGAYRISVFVNTNLGVLAFNGSFYQTLYVTEQKR